MKLYKLLLKEVKEENKWGYDDKEAIKVGKVAFPFKGKTDDTEFDFKKGDEVLYQYGTNVKLEGEDLVLVSLTSLVAQK